VFIEESFAIWTIRSGATFPAPSGVKVDLSQVLSRTGRWHHQLSQNGAAIGYAVSGPSDRFGEHWTLLGVHFSDLANKIARAVARIDQDRPADDIEAYLTVVPSHKLVFFYLRGYSTDEVFVVSGPSARKASQEGRFYRPEEFVQLLVPVRGLDLGMLSSTQRGARSGESSKKTVTPRTKPLAKA
jgi:hypothetical protein